MTQFIQAYFRTENEAEDVKILLQTYDIDTVEIGKIEDGTNLEGRLFVPLAAGTATNGTGTSGAGTAAAIDGDGLAPLVGFATLDDERDLDDLNYVLAVQVKDEDYDEIVHLIRRNRGQVLKPE